MRKITTTLAIACLLSATSVAPVSAHGWRGQSVNLFNPLWPVAAALSIPAAIIGTVANAVVPVPVEYGYTGPPAPVGYGYAVSPAPVVYSGPATYYVPRQYYAPRVVYAAPRGYYGYYPYRGHRFYRRGW